jgi:hypothetical protein
MADFNLLSRKQEHALHSIFDKVGAAPYFYNEDVSWIEDDMMAFLCRDGYFSSKKEPIIVSGKQVAFSEIEYHIKLTPTNKARTYFQHREAYREKFKYENIRVPVIASIVTTLMTSGTIWLISQLLR